MNLLDVFKKKHEKELAASHLDARLRKQLNMMVDYRLCEALKVLSQKITVPRNVVGEHIIEVGSFYVAKAVDDEHKLGLLRKHLIDSHLLDDGYDDDESILRIGEAGSISELLKLAEKVLHRWHTFQRSLGIAEKTNSVDYLNRCQRDFSLASIELAMWLEKHGLFDDPSGKNIGN
jgi:hypothetical protein